jgi:hypothetical protein
MMGDISKHDHPVAVFLGEIPDLDLACCLFGQGLIAIPDAPPAKRGGWILVSFGIPPSRLPLAWNLQKPPLLGTLIPFLGLDQEPVALATRAPIMRLPNKVTLAHITYREPNPDCRLVRSCIPSSAQ